MSVDIEKIAQLLTQADARIGHLEMENEKLRVQLNNPSSFGNDEQLINKTASDNNDFEQYDNSDFSLGEAVSISTDRTDSAESALDSFLT